MEKRTLKQKLTPSSSTLYFSAYAALTIISVTWTHIHNLSLWVGVIATIPFILADAFTNYNPNIMAYLYSRRRPVAFSILIICSIVSTVFYYRWPIHVIYNDLTINRLLILIVQFILQGAIIGVTIRMLLLNLFAGIIKAGDIHKAKFLIILAWIVFLIVCPINERHRSLSSIYVLGLGLGFLLHYQLRPQDKKSAQSTRLRENIMTMVNSISKLSPSSNSKSIENGLTNNEKRAIDLYSNQKWNRLKKLLASAEESIILTFIELSMYRKLHQYETALTLITEKMEKENISHVHFYNLHTALNESDRFNNSGQWINRDKIFENLEKAYKINPNCLLTNATYALRIASEIEDVHADNSKNKLALNLIWHAMKLYEIDSSPKVVSLITGMTVPVTYTFLLDTYGYVLLKCGRTRFSRALLLQCMYQDPSFSATYLHLAEWYIIYYSENNQQTNRRNNNWRKAAKLCLYIALTIEKENDKENKGTLISNRAKQLMQKLN